MSYFPNYIDPGRALGGNGSLPGRLAPLLRSRSFSPERGSGLLVDGLLPFVSVFLNQFGIVDTVLQSME